MDPKEIRRAFGLLCLVLLVAALLLTGGCTQLPLRSLWALRQFDMETFDPAQLRAAVLLPQGVRFAGQGVSLDLRLVHGATGEVLDERLWMRPAQAQQAASLPPAGGRPGHWVTLKLSDADVARVVALRERTKGWKQAAAGKLSGNKKNSLSLTMEPQLCRQATVPARLQVSAWLRWAPSPGDVLMLDEADLDELWKDLPKPLPACGGLG